MAFSRARTAIWAGTSMLTGLLLVAAAIIVPRAYDIEFNAGISDYPRFPPLHANWLPDFGPRVILPIVVAMSVVTFWSRIERLGWRTFVITTWTAAWLWTFTLAYVDGPDGLAETWRRRGEYVYDARRVDSIGNALSGFVDRIPLDATDHWFIHVAGHPPGALLAFVGLDHVGITDEFWIGMTVMTIGTTAVIAALLAVRTLGDESLARRGAPWLVLAPMAACAFLGGIVAARLTHAFGARRVVIVTSLVMAITLLALVAARTQLWEIALTLTAYGFALGVNLATLSTLVVVSVDPARTAVASAVNFNVRNIGGAVGAAAMATVVTADLIAGGLPRESGYVAGFVLLAVTMATAGVLALAIPRTDDSERTSQASSPAA
ncbi:MAG: hypothetical protein L0K86_26930 [Actinomycetia bacterium]|nr:hypothetical protein [Actinomycetes bacterium]